MAEAQESLDVSDLKENFLECSVCLEHFDQGEKRPRLLLNCLHSFCTQCLEQLLKKERGGQVTCPNCRQVQKVKGTAQSLPIDPVRNKLVDYVRFKKGKKIPCTDCPDGSDAVARCHECQSYMCTSCKEAHHRNRVTRKHTCQSLEQALNEPVKNFLSHRCEDHPDYKIEFYCEKCSSLCCISCSIVKHKGHDLDPIEDAANYMLSSLKTKIKDVEKSASVMSRKKSSLGEQNKLQEMNMKHTTDLINNKFDGLIGKLNGQRNKLITELKERTEINVNALKKQQEATEDSLAQMESTLEYFKQMESKSDDCEVLSAGPVLVQSLEAAAAVDQTQDVQHPPTWTFSPGAIDKVMSKLHRFGELHSDTKRKEGTAVDQREEDAIVEGYCKKMLSFHELPVGLNEDTLVNYVEVCGDCDVKKLEFSLDQTAALVTVDAEPDWGKLSKMTKTRHLEKKRVRFERLPLSSKVSVMFYDSSEKNMQNFYKCLTPKPKNMSIRGQKADTFYVLTFSSPDDVEAVLRNKDQLTMEYNVLMSIYFENIGPVQDKSEMVIEAEVELTVGQSHLLLATRKLEEMRRHVDIDMRNQRRIMMKGKLKPVSDGKVVLQDFKSQYKEMKVACSEGKRKYLLDETCEKLMLRRMSKKNIVGAWYQSGKQLMICATSESDLKNIANWIERHLKEKIVEVSREGYNQALKVMRRMEEGSFLLVYGHYFRELVLDTQHEEFDEACQIVDDIVEKEVKEEEKSRARRKLGRSREQLQDPIKQTLPKDHKLFLQRFKQKDLKALETTFEVGKSLEGSETKGTISGSGSQDALQGFKTVVRDLKMGILPLSPEDSNTILSSGYLGCLEKYVGDTERCVISHKTRAVANESRDETLEGAVGGTTAFLRKIKFTVEEGEIAKETSDIIVNTVTKDYDMRVGAISKSLASAGGYWIEKEFKDKQHMLHEGGFVVTGDGNLKCKQVFHCCLHPSRSPQAAESFQDVMSEMLKYADTLGSKTISFPALGTGGLGYSPECAANIMFNSVTEYSKKNKSIEEVRIVIYKNTKALKAFRDVEEDVSPKSDPRYLTRVKEELAAQGVTVDDLGAAGAYV